MRNKSIERIKVIVAGISSLVLTVGIARFSYTPMLPLMKEQISLSDVAGGWLAAVNYFGYFTGAVIAISLKNLVQKFYFYKTALLVAIVTTILMGYTTNTFVWGLLRYFSGISSVAGLILASGLVLNWLTSHQFKKELGLHFSGLAMGIFVSGLIFIFFEKQFLWDRLWIIYGFFGILFFFPAWFWMPKPQSTNHHSIHKTSEENVSKKWFAMLLAVYFCAGFGYVISATFIVDILKRLNIFEGGSAYIWVVLGLSGVPATYIWDAVARKTGQTYALILAYFLQIISVLIPAMSEDKFLNLLGAVLFGSTFVGIVSLMLTLIGNRFPQNPAKAMAKLTLTYGVAQITAPIISGYLLKSTGNYKIILYITSVMLCIGIFLISSLRKFEKTDNGI